mgnify:FL=1|jgi:hypothetical protein
MKDLVNATLAKEVGLDRPPKSLFERVFRFCLYYVVIGGLVIAILKLFLDNETVESDGGPIGSFFGILFGVCFLYMLNYMAAKFVKSRLVKISWFSLMSLVALLIIHAVLNKK